MLGKYCISCLGGPLGILESFPWKFAVCEKRRLVEKIRVLGTATGRNARVIVEDSIWWSKVGKGVQSTIATNVREM